MIRLLQQALACSVLALQELALHAAATAGPRHVCYQAIIALVRRPLSISRALHVLSSCVILCLAPPASDLLDGLVVGVHIDI